MLYLGEMLNVGVFVLLDSDDEGTSKKRKRKNKAKRKVPEKIRTLSAFSESLKAKLRNLLTRPLVPNRFETKYPTRHGRHLSAVNHAG
jgi:hypothetical protein